MPLLPGKENVGHNIAAEEQAGKPRKQAIAIALKEAGESYEDKDRKRQEDAGDELATIAGARKRKKSCM